jgi:hypothetical protein
MTVAIAASLIVGQQYFGATPAKQANVLLDLAPPRSRFQIATPLPSLPGIMVDSHMNGWGLAQQAARAKGLQARVLWVDCTANIDRYNEESKIISLVGTVAASGFNTIVFDIKPISGHVAYPSKIAPKLTEWKGRALPADFDPLAVFVRECKAAGISLLVSLNAFSEGHRDFRVGPGYDMPELQSVLYEGQPYLRANGQSFAVSLIPNKLPEDDSQLAVFIDPTLLPGAEEGLFAITMGRDGKAIDGFENGGIGVGVPTVPRGSVAVFGRGRAAEFLRQNVVPGEPLKFETQPVFVPMSERPQSQVPLMMNPHHPDVQKRALDILREVVSAYDVDGVLYDDRMRYAGMDADFSAQARGEFEKWLGRKIVWPDDVYRVTYTPSFVKGMRPGPYYDAWLVWRALTLRNFIAKARAAVKEVRERTLFGIYAGSWYGEYASLGANWASPESEAGFWFLTPQYQKTGFAGHLDLLITGCYYPTATIFEAMERGVGLGVTVEAAGSLTNRMVRDRAWSYAGISLSQFKGNPAGLQNALQAACAATQGVMVFDLSHDIEPMWPVFRMAFQKRAKPPHLAPDVLHDARKKRLALELRGVKERPAIVVAGAPGAGQ